MILVDANLLLYAYDSESPHHAASRDWLEAVLSGAGPVRFAWLTLWAFVRIATNPQVFVRPLSSADAHAIVASWLHQPNAAIIEPTDQHLETLGTLLTAGQASAGLVMDAALAAIAVEHGATLCSTDRDFARFPGLKWQNPLESR